ncbi:MAG TPA: hypothetical protein VII59_20255 [Streptosporangiaceae bacterium]
MTPSLSCLPARERGPEPDLTLAACRLTGCNHIACRRADAAHDRLTPPVPAAGTVRRLQALALLGHSTGALAARLNVADRVVRRYQRGKPAEVPAALAAAVAALYDDLWDVNGGSAKSVQMAVTRGWAPPMAWDDDPEDDNWIDDPSGAPADWRPRRITLAERAEDIADVMAAGHATIQQAAWRLGMRRDHLEQVIRRARAGGAA